MDRLLGGETDEPYNLMDGASGELEALVREVAPQQRITTDPRIDLEKRLEAYEDIIDSEVGDTSLVRARNIEREMGFRQLYLKFEGGNPTGTQKDRIAFAQAMDALRRGFDTLTVATCGNYGVAVAMAASLAGLKSVIFIPAAYHTRRMSDIRDLGAEIRTVSGDYESAVLASQEWARQNECYDANPGGDNTRLQLLSLRPNRLRDLRRTAGRTRPPWRPRSPTAPPWPGSIVAFLSLYRRGKTSRLPRIVAGSSFRKNPDRAFFIGKGLATCEDLKPCKHPGNGRSMSR
jgi:threonine synthase